MVQFVESLETSKLNNGSNSNLPDLVDDSDDNVSENGSEHDDDLRTSLEVDPNEYQWNPVKITSLSRSKQKLVKRMLSENFWSMTNQLYPIPCNLFRKWMD